MATSLPLQNKAFTCDILLSYAHYTLLHHNDFIFKTVSNSGTFCMLGARVSNNKTVCTAESDMEEKTS